MDKSKKYWEQMSKTINSPSETKNKRPDTSKEEAAFIREYLTKSDEVIDIGSGTGLIVNKIYKEVKTITAVETFQGLSQFIVNAPNVLVINAQLVSFCIRKTFDKAICTGVMQYFTQSEAIIIYKSIFDMLKKNGLLIIRSHCGLKKTVTINHSKEIGKEYFAEYRQIDEEKKMLLNTGFSEVQVLDKVPKELNIYDNTHHFMFICKK